SCRLRFRRSRLGRRPGSAASSAGGAARRQRVCRIIMTALEAKLHERLLADARRRGVFEHATIAVGRAGLLAVILGFWAYASGRWLDRDTISDPIAVLFALKDLISSGRLWPDLLQTASEVIAGYGIGTALGVLLAATFALWPSMERVLRPFLIAIYSIPKIA